jgi:hypothetical protein
MPVSFVLKLVPDALSEGRIVGRIEAVGTGEQAHLRSAEELIEFLHSQARPPADDHIRVLPDEQAR